MNYCEENDDDEKQTLSPGKLCKWSSRVLNTRSEEAGNELVHTLKRRKSQSEGRA